MYARPHRYNAADNCESENKITQLCLDHCHVWTKVTATGLGPGPVAGHTAAVVDGGDTMVVIGGCAKLGVVAVSKCEDLLYRPCLRPCTP